jgi:hypothetical protein
LGLFFDLSQETDVGKVNRLELPEIEKMDKNRNADCRKRKEKGRVDEFHQGLKIIIMGNSERIR